MSRPFVQGPFRFATALADGTIAYVEEDRGYTTPCWVWKRATSGVGYGLCEGGRGRKPKLAHRVSYERLVGPIPPGMDLDHLCRVRACVNPDHLEPVTRAVNAQRGARAVLTTEKVIEARHRAAAGERLQDIADAFGIRVGAIHKAVVGGSWLNAAGPVRPVRVRLTDDDARHIRALRAAGLTLDSIAARYSVTRACISAIARGRSHKEVSH